MKFIALFVLFIGVSCQFDPATFDWLSVKPITQIPTYRTNFPKIVANEPVDETVRVFDRNGRIVSGDIASPTDYPFMVGLLISFATDSTWCSSSLVSRTYLLTAGSCLFGAETQGTALLGASDIGRVSEFQLISGYEIHPNLNSDQDHDIGMARLQREIVPSATIQVVRLPNFRQQEADFDKQKVFVSGWGGTGASHEAIPTQNLRSTQATVITNTSCRIRFLGIRDSHICTNVETGAPCIGDEGSALTIVEFDNVRTQIGIFSWHYRFGCDRGRPPVYTRVTAYLDWIQNHSDVVIRPGFD